MTDHPIPLLTPEAQIKRRLRRHLKQLGFTKDAAGHLLPPGNSKECFRTLHAAQRAERLAREQQFVARAWSTTRGTITTAPPALPGKLAAYGTGTFNRGANAQTLVYKRKISSI